MSIKPMIFAGFLAVFAILFLGVGVLSGWTSRGAYDYITHPVHNFFHRHSKTETVMNGDCEVDPPKPPSKISMAATATTRAAVKAEHGVVIVTKATTRTPAGGSMEFSTATAVRRKLAIAKIAATKATTRAAGGIESGMGNP